VALSDFFNNLSKTVKSNSPEILTAFGVAGVIVTTYLTARASFKSQREITEMEENNGYISEEEGQFKERFALVWKNYIPAGISGAVTIACIIGSNKASGNRTAAAVVAYSLTEKAFSEYKERVVEELGKGKSQKIVDQIAQDKVLENPSTSKEVIIIDGEHVLCCELYTGRYFRSNMDRLRKAENEINARIVHECYVALEEFYDLIGLSNTSVSSNLGWSSDRLLSLEFSTVISKDGEPCLAFDYNYVKPLALM
jgi:hypothetical protein